MKHHQYHEWLQLSFYNELHDEEKMLLEQHLQSCSECRKELEELQAFHATLADAGAFEPDEKLLSEVRQDLRVLLRSKRTGTSLRDRLSELTAGLLPHYKIAFGGLAMLGVGIVAGRFFFSPMQPQPNLAQQVRDDKFTPTLEGEPRITNIRFMDSDATDGEIEFTFDAVSPVHIKGNINDERVQKVLAHALVNDQNPGIRLRSVNAFAAQAQHGNAPDRDVKAALILAAKTDGNPAVRKEALKTLQRFPFDNDIKQTYLHVLMRDTNPALRIAAINALDSARVSAADEQLREVLRTRVQSDENSYVRLRAKAVLEEGRMQ